MNVPFYELLDDLYRLEPRADWVALCPRGKLNLKGYRTSRIGKITDENILMFTIGATELGVRQNLNAAIREILFIEGFRPIEGKTTSGSRAGSGEYVGLNLNYTGPQPLRTILAKVEGAIIAAKQNAI